MDILDLRYFASADLRPLLEDEVRTWQARLHWDFRAVAEMILRYAEMHILPGVAAIDGGRVLGYCFFLSEQGKGGIGDVYVDTAAGDGIRETIECDLARQAIQRLRQCSGLHRSESQLLIHPAGHLAQPFQDGGHRRYRRLFLALPLSAWHKLEDEPPQRSVCGSEIVVQRWRKSFCEPAAEVITAAYQGHVDCDIGEQYRTLEGALGFLHNIVRYPTCGNFDASASFLAWHAASQRPAAVLLCSRLRRDVGHITQVCTLPEFRSRGIGEMLIRNCWQDLASRGFSELSLTVTEDNRRALELYRRLGFVAVHTFDAFVWNE